MSFWMALDALLPASHIFKVAASKLDLTLQHIGRLWCEGFQQTTRRLNHSFHSRCAASQLPLRILDAGSGLFGTGLSLVYQVLHALERIIEPSPFPELTLLSVNERLGGEEGRFIYHFEAEGPLRPASSWTGDPRCPLRRGEGTRGIGLRAAIPRQPLVRTFETQQVYAHADKRNASRGADI